MVLRSRLVFTNRPGSQPSPRHSACLQNKNVSFVLSGQMQERFIERSQHQSLSHRETEQIGIRHLIVPVNSF